jgi:hypothetical protein
MDLDSKQRMELKEMPYKEFLQTPFWDVIRKKKLKSANHKCEICSKSNIKLAVHHLTYEHHGFEDIYLDDLQVLCDSCHLVCDSDPFKNLEPLFWLGFNKDGSFKFSRPLTKYEQDQLKTQ